MVLLLGLGVFCFPFLFGGSRGLTFCISGFLVGPPGGRPSFPLMVCLFASFLRLAPLWEISGISKEEDLSYQGEEPISFSLLSMWEGAGTTLVPVDSSSVPSYQLGARLPLFPCIDFSSVSVQGPVFHLMDQVLGLETPHIGYVEASE